MLYPFFFSCLVADLRYTVDKFRLRKMYWTFSRWISGQRYHAVDIFWQWKITGCDNACCVWYAVYQLLPPQLQLWLKSTPKYEEFFNTLLLKTWRKKSVAFCSLTLNLAILLACVCCIMLLQLFLMDWSLKDVSITVKVKTGEHAYTAVDSLSKSYPSAPNHYRSKKVLIPLNYESSNHTF